MEMRDDGVERGHVRKNNFKIGIGGDRWWRDYYDLLQVPRGASEAVIKRSFRKLALKYHPDKVTGTDKEKEAASKTFTEISHELPSCSQPDPTPVHTAYEVLVDPEQRKIYDRYGEEGVKEHAGQKASGRQPGGNIFDMWVQMHACQDKSLDLALTQSTQISTYCPLFLIQRIGQCKLHVLECSLQHKQTFMPILPHTHISFRFFGGGGFGGFGGFGMGDEEEEELKGHTINIDLYVTLKDLYIGRELKEHDGCILSAAEQHSCTPMQASNLPILPLASYHDVSRKHPVLMLLSSPGDERQGGAEARIRNPKLQVQAEASDAAAGARHVPTVLQA
eukprot:scaffold100840_cov19-Tisochrysis_lutea.AAC.1